MKDVQGNTIRAGDRLVIASASVYLYFATVVDANAEVERRWGHQRGITIRKDSDGRVEYRADSQIRGRVLVLARAENGAAVVLDGATQPAYITPKSCMVYRLGATTDGETEDGTEAQAAG